MTGRIHSFQSMGAVDGPGVRFVVFFSGCPLRCVYCHNPDTWDGGERYTPQEIVQKILRYRPYFGQDGGVTLSGGEVLMQAEFAAELLKTLKEEGIHTAIDTAGIGDLSKAEALLKFTDLVICDIKFPDDEGYRKHCGGNLTAVCAFLSLCETMQIPLWIRQVVVPGLTDSEDSVQRTLAIAQQFHNLQKIELLPFRKLCETKYEALGLSFPLANTPPCSADTLSRLCALIPPQYR